jgi:hypothetical protein
MDVLGPIRILSPVLAMIGPAWERRNRGRKAYLEPDTTSG